MTTQQQPTGAPAHAAPPVVRTVGLFTKRMAQGVPSALRDVEAALSRRGIELVLDRECARQLGRSHDGAPSRAIAGRIDLAISLGGDGTFLSVARIMAETQTPMMGINLGRLGFLTQVEPDDFEAFLERYLRGECVVGERMMLEAVLETEPAREPLSVLNDVVINRAALSRMLEFELLIDGAFVTNYRADGLIIATATGSTAYSMAAGGPILMPEMSAIVINPICPHALSQRPLVVRGASVVRVKVRENRADAFLSLDGQVGFPLKGDAEVVVRRSPHVTRIVRDPGVPFYEVLRHKLGWGEKSSRGGRFS